MVYMERLYQQILEAHFIEHNQIAIVSGARQVGKTTLARTIHKTADVFYLNWDDFNDRELILKGSQPLAEHIGLD